MKSKLYLIILGGIALFGLFLFANFRLNDGNLHIVFCDVGQGDATYIRTPSGADFLIDAGPNDSVLSCLSSHMPFWDKNLEAVFLTHPDADHISGIASIFKQYSMDIIYKSDIESDTAIYSDIEKIIREKGIKTGFLYKGDNLKISDGVTLSTLWPGKEFVEREKDSAGQNKNIFSLVQLLTFKNEKMLFTGDIEAKYMDGIMEGLSDINIIKLPHHGSATGVDTHTFEKIKPSLAVISVGKNNRYKHPSSEVLSILKQNDIPYKRTDEVGEVEFIVSEKGIEVKN